MSNLDWGRYPSLVSEREEIKSSAFDLTEPESAITTTEGKSNSLDYTRPLSLHSMIHHCHQKACAGRHAK